MIIIIWTLWKTTGISLGILNYKYSFLQYKVYLFPKWSNAQIVDNEYPQGICSPIFIVEEFSGLIEHLSTFLIKDSMSA